MELTTAALRDNIPISDGEAAISTETEIGGFFIVFFNARRQEEKYRLKVDEIRKVFCRMTDITNACFIQDYNITASRRQKLKMDQNFAV